MIDLNSDDWCDSIGNEVHIMQGDDDQAGCVLSVGEAMIAIGCISLALWGVIWLLVVLLR